MIPESAVEAAVQRSWHLEITTSDVREILEAAAPHMLAGAWDSALQDADDQGYLYDHQSELLKTHNPYRGQA